MQGPIVAATDFSARADRAIDRAIMLGKQLGQKVILAHAIDHKQAEMFDKTSLDRQMREVLPEGLSGAGQVAFTYPEGSAPGALAQAASSHDAGLVVMGPARHNSLIDYLLGTAVDYTLRHCDQPVLVVKNRPHRPYAKIVLATDYSKPAAKALEWAMAEFPEAEFHLVHGCHMPFQELDQADYSREDVLGACQAGMARFVDDLAITDTARAKLATHIEISDPFQTVRRVAQRVGADLLVIGSHGESGFRHATIGSVANALLSSAAIDTLMVQTPD